MSLNGSVLSALDLGIGANVIGVDFDIRYCIHVYTRASLHDFCMSSIYVPHIMYCRRNYIFFSDVSQRFIVRFYNKQNGLILTSKALTTPGNSHLFKIKFLIEMYIAIARKQTASPGTGSMKKYIGRMLMRKRLRF